MRTVTGAVVAATLMAIVDSGPACAADIVNSWTVTQFDGGGIQRGDPVTLFWSVVPDGEAYERSSNSELIEYLDDGWNVPQVERTPVLTSRVWWDVMDSAYQQYGRVSGLRMIYRSEQNSLGQDTGLFGDIRIGGEVIDGDPGGVLADNTFPNHGDMRIDTSRDGNGVPSGIHSNVDPLRNLVAHESGHGVGLGHPDIAGADALMEGGLQTHFFGLQFDDVYGFNRLYGDPREKNGGNDTLATSYDLGVFTSRSSVSYGTDATDSVVEEMDDDWLGIDGTTDEDWFRLSVTKTAVLDIAVTPVGPTYQLSGTTFHATRQSDLSFEVYKSDGSLVRSVNHGGLGQAEHVPALTVLEAGDYHVRVHGEQDVNQFYQLDVTVDLPELLLTVNRDTGDVHMSGLESVGTGFDGYRLESPSGGLNPDDGAWLSFQDQGRGDWLESNPTSTSIQELLHTGVDQLGTEDSVYLGNFYTQVLTAPFGVFEPEDLAFSYLTPETGDTWLNAAVEFIGVPLQNNLVLTIDPTTGDATLTNESNTTVHLDGYSIASGSASLEPGSWNSFENQMLSDWTEANPRDTVLTELKPTGSMALLPGDIYDLGQLFDVLGTQDVELSYLLDGEVQFQNGAVLYGDLQEPTTFDLVLAVDPVTGEAVLRNEDDSVLEIDGYSISSASSSLDPEGWTSLEEQMLPDWFEANPSESVLSELNPSDVLSLASGETLNLGALFDVLGTQDLEFLFLLGDDDAFRLGRVEYGLLPGPGDYDFDGDVDADDYAVWAQSFGSTVDLAADGNGDGIVNAADYTIWRDHSGSSSATSGLSLAVPEPLALHLLVFSGLVFSVFCTRSRRGASFS